MPYQSHCASPLPTELLEELLLEGTEELLLETLLAELLELLDGVEELLLETLLTELLELLDGVEELLTELLDELLLEGVELLLDELEALLSHASPVSVGISAAPPDVVPCKPNSTDCPG